MSPSSDVPFVAPETHINPYFLSVSSTTSSGLAVFTPFPVLILFAVSHSDFASHAIARTLHSAYFSIKGLRLAMMKRTFFFLCFFHKCKKGKKKRQRATERILSMASSMYIFIVRVCLFLFLASILQMNSFESSAVGTSCVIPTVCRAAASRWLCMSLQWVHVRGGILNSTICCLWTTQKTCWVYSKQHYIQASSQHTNVLTACFFLSLRFPFSLPLVLLCHHLSLLFLLELL